MKIHFFVNYQVPFSKHSPFFRISEFLQEADDMSSGFPDDFWAYIQVEAMATLVFKEVLKSAPKNPWAHAANYLRDPRTADLIANFAASRDYTTQELLDRDFRTYAISTDMAGAQTGRGWDEEQNEEQDHEQDEEPDQEQIEDQYHGYIEEEQYDKQDERLDEGQLIRTGLPPSVNL